MHPIIDFDPVIFGVGGFELRWYGLMYVLGFVVGGQLLRRLVKSKFLPIPIDKVDTYVFYLIIGMFFGARFFYVFIYNWDYYSENLLDLLSVWKGGLSFHGAVVGLCISTYIFAKKMNLHFYQVADSMAVAGSPGLLFGRIGNFINGELYGRITDSPVGMIFSDAGPYPRHASQLYEGILEGIVLFIILYIVHSRQKYYGYVTSLFIIGYGSFRFMVEFFREPDAQLGYYLNYFTMGQILCFVMMIISVFVFFHVRKLKIVNPIYRL